MSNIYSQIIDSSYLAFPETLFIFYVYAYIRKYEGTPYYIGKGRGSRAYQKHAGVTTPKNKSLIVFMETNLSEIGAFALERRNIRWYGRKDLGTGILLNKTDGGEGSSGAIVSEETRHLMSLMKKGKLLSQQHKNNLSSAKMGKKQTAEFIEKRAAGRRGTHHSSETKELLSKARKGKKLSPEWCANISAAKKGKKQTLEMCIKKSKSMMGKNKGKNHSSESRIKMSQTRKGKPQSADHIAARSASRRKNNILRKMMISEL